MTKEQLQAEKERLQAHINFWNINTPEREKKVKRIAEIETILKRGS
jgi:hypothetical protein